MRDLRNRLGMSQDDLAAATGYSRNYISQVEIGKKNPGKRFLRDLHTFEQIRTAGRTTEDPPPSTPTDDPYPKIREIPVRLSATDRVSSDEMNCPHFSEEVSQMLGVLLGEQNETQLLSTQKRILSSTLPDPVVRRVLGATTELLERLRHTKQSAKH